MDIRSLRQIKTAENVDLNVELAGLGSRVFAYFIDFWISLCFYLLILLLIGYSKETLKELGVYKHLVDESAVVLIGVISLIYFLAYHILQEWLWQGKTIGKSILKIQVVRNNGQPIGFWEALARNIMRTIDVYAGGLGLIVMMFSPSEKRLGDYLAGSLVIHSEPITNVHKLSRPRLQTDSSEPQSNLSHQSISLDEYQLIKSFLERKKQLIPTSRISLENDLRQYFAKRLHLSIEDQQDPTLFEKLQGEFEAL